MTTLAKPQHLRSNAKQPSQFSHRITELATLLGKNSKSGVTLGLDQLCLLTLFDLFALHFCSLFGFVLNPTPGFGGTFYVSINRLKGNCAGYTDMVEVVATLMWHFGWYR